MYEEKIGYYVCALVDILGQKKILSDLDAVKDPRDESNVNSIFGNTYGRKKKLKNIFSETRIAVCKPNAPTKIKINYFSDLVVLHNSLSSHGKLDISNLKSLLIILSGAFLYSLSVGIPLRGGIDLGLGIVDGSNGDDGEVYGNALSRAYELESTKANSIRVLVGKNLVEFLKLCKGYSDAEDCLTYIKKDHDGEYILDYLAKQFKSLGHFTLMSERAKSFLIQERENSESNQYISKKYSDALEYFKCSGVN